MNEVALEPVNIAVVAPTGAGKTALISTICDYIKSKTNKADGFILEVEGKAAKELNTFRMKLKANLAAKNVKFDSATIDPTSECTHYDFSISLQNGDLRIKQPFKILDIPGAFINDRFAYENSSEYEEFINHLDHSRILWIPIDAAVLMEAKSEAQITASEIIRRISDLETFVKEWSDFAAKNGKTDYCNFVLLKCESYFSKDVLKKHNFCQKRFDESYKEIIDLVKSTNSEDKLSCVAVETIGCVRVNRSKWNTKEKEEACDVEFDVLGTHQEIRGVDALLIDVMKVARANINEQIDIVKKRKSSEASELRKFKEELIAKYQSEKDILTTRQTELNYELEKLQKDELELVNKGIVDVIIDFFNDNIKKLREKIRNTKLHILSIEQDIESLNSKIEEISSMQVDTDNDLTNVEAEIAVYTNLLEKLSSLTSENISSEYYRPL